MALYILDTDHLSLYGRGHPALTARLSRLKAQLSTTAINFEEQMRGRLAQVAEARTAETLSNAYQHLIDTTLFLGSCLFSQG